MGLNSRNSDIRSELAEKVTHQRETRDYAAREKVRLGLLSIDEYLISIKGFRREHLDRVRPRFRKAIMGS